MKKMVFWVMTGVVTVAQAGSEEVVKEIRGWYSTIQAAKPTTTKTIKFESDREPLEGSAISRDFPEKMQSLTLEYGAEHGGAEEYHYFRDGALFFVYQVDFFWRFSGEERADGQSETIETRTENRFYFKEGKCVRQLRRTATAKDARQLAALVGKLPQKEVTPGDDAARIYRQGMQLVKATTEVEVLKVFGAE